MFRQKSLVKFISNSIFNSLSDCQDYCETFGCNNEFDLVADLFDQGTDISCHSCTYGRFPDGSIIPGSNQKCSLDDVSGQIQSQKCPVYANAACFTATTSNNVRGTS